MRGPRPLRQCRGHGAGCAVCAQACAELVPWSVCTLHLTPCCRSGCDDGSVSNSSSPPPHPPRPRLFFHITVEAAAHSCAPPTLLQAACCTTTWAPRRSSASQAWPPVVAPCCALRCLWRCAGGARQGRPGRLGTRSCPAAGQAHACSSRNSQVRQVGAETAEPAAWGLGRRPHPPSRPSAAQFAATSWIHTRVLHAVRGAQYAVDACD